MSNDSSTQRNPEQVPGPPTSEGDGLVSPNTKANGAGAGAAMSDWPSVSAEVLRRQKSEELDSLYRRYGSVIREQCRRLLGAEAEDALQEVFLRVIANIEMVPLSGEALFWIRRIATNCCLNELRSRRRRLQLQGLQVSDGRPSPEHAADVMAARDFVRRILARTPDRMAVAVRLYFVDGLTQEEISEALGVSRRTVVSYVRNVKRRATRAAHALP